MEIVTHLVSTVGREGVPQPYIVKPNITPTVQEHVKFAVQRDSYKVLVEVVALTWAM